MGTLKHESGEFLYFCKAFKQYLQRRTHQAWVWFECKKDALVTLLVAKRGLYQRPFLHTSLFLLVVIGIVGAPLIKSYGAQANQLDEITPPSAVLSSFDEQETTTQKSDRVRDGIILHPVVEGETLGTIAEKYAISIDSIKWANPKLKSEKLAIGQELSIPPVSGVVVKVQKGDTIYSLAKKYKVEAQNILNYPFNDFTDLDTFALASGQLLVIPDGVMPESKPVYSPQMIAQAGTTSGSGQFIWPTNGTITQNPVWYHMALDIANNTLPPVAAADSGKVVTVERQRFGYGWHVIIDHGNGYQTLYAHLSDIYVSVGQSLARGSILGKLGSTGRSTGPHLHFEVRKNGTAINPRSVLK